jgi:hypothetical protein
VRHRLVSDQLFLDDELIAGAEHRTAPLWITSLVDALASGVARGVLQELYLDLQTMSSETIERAAIQRLVVASVSLPLTRLHVTSRRQLQHACAVGAFA